MSVERINTTDLSSLYSPTGKRKDVFKTNKRPVETATFGERRLKRYAVAIFECPEWTDKNANGRIDTGEVDDSNDNRELLSQIDRNGDGVSAGEISRYMNAGTVNIHSMDIRKVLSNLSKDGEFMVSEKPVVRLITESRVPKDLSSLNDYDTIMEGFKKPSVMTLALSAKEGRLSGYSIEGDDKVVIICVPKKMLKMDFIDNMVIKQLVSANQYLSGSMEEVRSITDLSVEAGEKMQPAEASLLQKLPAALLDIERLITDIELIRDDIDSSYIESVIKNVNAAIMLVNKAVEIASNYGCQDLVSMILDMKDAVIYAEEVTNINRKLPGKMQICPDITPEQFDRMYK